VTIAIDRRAIKEHVAMLHELAAPCAGQGLLIVAGYGEDPVAISAKTGKAGRPLAPVVGQFPIGFVDQMTTMIERMAEQAHRNVYCPFAVMRPDLAYSKKGGEEDVVAVLALVADFDDADAKRWRDRLTVAPDYVLQTSAGRYQTFYLLLEPASVAKAKPIATRLRDHAKSDHGSLDMSHVWRVPGTLNWPNARKLAGGRSPEPQLVLVEDLG
jgi:hypothetical protein